MVLPITLSGRRAWLKQYADGDRALALALLDLVARRFGLHALRPPPHRGGDGARAIELRRLQELRAQAVNVPDVLGSGRGTLVLSDNGRSLSVCLDEADAAGRDALVALALRAIARAHARGAYLGQPLPRNMTYDGRDVGFIDFEEDPLEVMELRHAQARDWLMFGYGVAKHYRERPQALQALIRTAMADVEAPVVAHAHAVTGRLRWVARAAKAMGRRAQVLAQAVLALHGATSLTVLALVVLCVDWAADGELDLLQAFF